MAGHLAAEAAAADAQLAAAVAGQQAEAEAASQRQLAFIDRLLADKDSLSLQVGGWGACTCMLQALSNGSSRMSAPAPQGHDAVWQGCAGAADAAADRLAGAVLNI